MKVLVTGATGFLGHHLLARLKTMGAEVFGLGRDLKMAPTVEALHARFIPIDLSNPVDFERLPERIDWIVHCAALSSPWGRPHDFYRSNVLATRHVVEYALKAGARRFVHISSPSIYVDRFDKLNVYEDDPLPEIQLNEYIATKRLAEAEVDAANRLGLAALTLRPQGIVGRGDRAIFPRILKTAKRGIVPRIGKGETLTDLTHVGNVVEAIMCALNAPAELNGRKYNITNGEPVEIYSVIADLLKSLAIPYRWKPLSLNKAYKIGATLEWTSRNLLFYREPLLTRYTACALGASRTLNIDRARKELGYQPRLSLKQAMHEVASAMQGH